ncbi:MAG TPA: hypothetical protein VIR16_12965 [Candidatus Limnocylindrales bacterium]
MPGRMNRRITWRRALAAALVITVSRPATWVVALAGFLAGGGVVILAWPILVLPTPSGLQNILGAPVATLAFGSPSGEFVRLVAGTAITATIVFVGGLLAGAWAERRGIAMVLVAGEEEGYTAAVPRLATLPAVLRVAVIRLTAMIPPLIVFILAWPTLYAVTYRELILPEDLVTPLPVRVVAQLPVQLTVLLLVWGAADLAAALAVRRLIVERRRLATAWLLGWADLLARPYRVIPAALLGDSVLVVAAGPALLASAVAWTRVREALELAPDSPLGIGVTVMWVSIWLGCLVLAGFGAAFRAAILTLEGARRA